ncbi:hypothetical protein [Hyphococcus sp.]|uniref:hypothetical protein n=1 Tax=Hyphococcus sp. TaxID=2038636 RepID=UPI002082EC68|nr:MAG: hypothetical protein DHS20C04_10010 [Marinicaulis sp.]
MILRRITEHVKAQNWFAVALDFLIVVVGVFVGLQVSNWNENLAEKDLEKRYATYLHEEINGNIEYFTDRTIKYEESQNTLIGYYDYLTGSRNQPPADEELRGVLCKFGINRYGSTNSSVYDELVSSGRLSLIGHWTAREALNDFREKLAGSNASMAVADTPLQRGYQKLDRFLIRKTNLTENAADSCILQYTLLEGDASAAAVIAEIQTLELVYLINFKRLLDSAVSTREALQDGYPHIQAGQDMAETDQ